MLETKKSNFIASIATPKLPPYKPCSNLINTIYKTFVIYITLLYVKTAKVPYLTNLDLLYCYRVRFAELFVEFDDDFIPAALAMGKSGFRRV